jgi:peptide/nickel transport system permease protein
VKSGEAFLDIVWRQFRKNRTAYASLFVIGLLFLLAIWAPLIASDQPLSFSENGHTIFPWLVALFNPAEVVDFVFNMALLAFIPCVLLGVMLWRVWARREVPPRTRVLKLVGLNLLMLFGMIYLFGWPSAKDWLISIYPKCQSIVRPGSVGEFFVVFVVVVLVLSLRWIRLLTLFSGSRRLTAEQWKRILVVVPCASLGFCIVLGFPDIVGIHQTKPENAYFSRNFKKTEFETNGKSKGLYALVPYGPTEQDLENIFKPPLTAPQPGILGLKHWLGTDDLGRDVLARMLYGSRISLTVGFIAVTLYMTIGIIVGSVAGYFGGWVDILISRMIEIMMMFPSFFLILTLVGLLGPSLYIIMFVIGITGWPGVARLIRGEFLRQRAIDYVTAARALGASHFRIIFRQLLPNALAPAFVSAPFGIAGAIVTEAGLSVLGFGVRPPTPTWGNLLNLATQYIHMWWLVVFPGLAIFVSVTVYNLVGSALRDATDPRLRV